MAKKNVFITDDLDWAENQLFTWKEYIDSNPLHLLTDRLAYRQVKGGGQVPVVIASIEQQITSIRNTTKDYLALLEVVNRLREQEETKKEARGGGDVPFRMQ